MSRNSEIRENIELCRRKIFETDEKYWNDAKRTAAEKKEWEKRCNDPLTFDGLICDDSDESCDILYLLKEATYNGYEKYRNKHGNQKEWFPQERTWDFIQMTNDLVNCKELRIESIWPDLCRWTHVFRSVLNDNDLSSYIELEEKYKNQEADFSILRQTAIVNVKKTAGESSSKDDLLKEVAIEFSTLIKDEVEIINPQIIVCCGTFEQAKTIWNPKACCRMKCGSEIFSIENDGKTCLVVDFCHPSARIKKAAMFAYAKEITNEIKTESY